MGGVGDPLPRCLSPISGVVARRKVAAMMKGRGLSRRKGHKLRREGRREGADEVKGHHDEEGARAKEEGAQTATRRKARGRRQP